MASGFESKYVYCQIFLQNWKQRWFTLNRYELKYFKDKMVSVCSARGHCEKCAFQNFCGFFFFKIHFSLYWSGWHAGHLTARLFPSVVQLLVNALVFIYQNQCIYHFIFFYSTCLIHPMTPNVMTDASKELRMNIAAKLKVPSEKMFPCCH